MHDTFQSHQSCKSHVHISVMKLTALMFNTNCIAIFNKSLPHSIYFPNIIKTAVSQQNCPDASISLYFSFTCCIQVFLQ